MRNENSQISTSLQLIPAAINAIMLTALLTVGHVKFSNLLAFLRSFALLIIFFAGAYTWRADLLWWSFGGLDYRHKNFTT